jgi:hypothetical protein
MKKLYFVIIAFIFCKEASSQNLLLNGSFENNTALTNINLSSDWPAFVSDSWEVDAGVMKLITFDSCATASDGNWYVASCPGCFIASSYLAFSLKTSTPIVAGSLYKISFDKKYCGDSTSIDIAVTDDSTFLGTIVHTFSGPTPFTWVHESVSFIAPMNGNYIVVNANISISATGRLAFDNFILEAMSTAIDELSFPSIHISPNPATHQITVQANASLVGSTYIISDQLGRTVLQGKLLSEDTIVSLDDLPVGIYLCSVGAHSKQTFNLIKN